MCQRYNSLGANVMILVACDLHAFISFLVLRNSQDFRYKIIRNLQWMKLGHTGKEIIHGLTVPTTHYCSHTSDAKVQATLRQLGKRSDGHKKNHLRLFYPSSL